MVYSIFILFLTFIPIIYLYLSRPIFFIYLIRDIRIGRILHYFILCLFGFALFKPNLRELSKTSLHEWIQLLNYFMILCYAAVFAIATNNKEDVEIDKISNVNRPLVLGTVDQKLYLNVAKISVFLSIVFAILCNWIFAISIICISIIYYIYSCKPFKIKRYVIIAKFLIGLNSLISCYCGFLLAGGQFDDFPSFWAFFILIPVSLMANFVDLKDIHGDKAAGIKTLPVYFGDHIARLIISGFCVFMYTTVIIYFRSWPINFLVITTGILHLLLIFKQPYDEKKLFLLHNFLFLGLISLILIKNQFEL